MSRQPVEQSRAKGDVQPSQDVLGGTNSLAPFAVIQVHLFDDDDDYQEGDEGKYRARYKKRANTVDCIYKAVHFNRHFFTRYLFESLDFLMPMMAFFVGLLLGISATLSYAS